MTPDDQPRQNSSTLTGRLAFVVCSFLLMSNMMILQGIMPLAVNNVWVGATMVMGGLALLWSWKARHGRR